MDDRFLPKMMKQKVLTPLNMNARKELLISISEGHHSRVNGSASEEQFFCKLSLENSNGTESEGLLPSYSHSKYRKKKSQEG